jgi:hypothetical protein
VTKHRRAARAFVVGAFSLSSALLMSCQSNREYPVDVSVAPELDIALSTDLAIPGDIDSIRIERSVAEISTAQFTAEEHELGPTGLELPTVLRFLDSQPELDRSVDVRVVAWKGATPVVFAEALFTMPDAGVVLVPLVLEAQCKGQVKTLADSSLASSCPDLQTCRDGHCASIDRRSESADGGAARAPTDTQAGFAGGAKP